MVSRVPGRAFIQLQKQKTKEAAEQQAAIRSAAFRLVMDTAVVAHTYHGKLAAKGSRMSAQVPKGGAFINSRLSPELDQLPSPNLITLLHYELPAGNCGRVAGVCSGDIDWESRVEGVQKAEASPVRVGFYCSDSQPTATCTGRQMDVI
jgi:hypothetical protein